MGQHSTFLEFQDAYNKRVKDAVERVIPDEVNKAADELQASVLKPFLFKISEELAYRVLAVEGSIAVLEAHRFIRSSHFGRTWSPGHGDDAAVLC